MRTISKLVSLVALFALFSACQDHNLDGDIISQNGLMLSPVQEVPANSSPATGSANVFYDKSTKKLSYTISYSNLTGNPVAGHIHGSAPRGTNASVLFPFMGLPAATSGTISGSAMLTAAQETDLLNGLFYINLHTPTYPGGELRGQIEFYNLNFNVSKRGIVLSGNQEVPVRPGPGTGSGDVVYNKNTKRLSYYVTYSNLTGNPTMGHIHGSAPRGTNASILFPFVTVPASNSGAVSGSVVLTSAQEADLLNGLYYFNFHTATYPGGEIRGQIEF